MGRTLLRLSRGPAATHRDHHGIAATACAPTGRSSDAQTQAQAQRSRRLCRFRTRRGPGGAGHRTGHGRASGRGSRTAASSASGRAYRRCDGDSAATETITAAYRPRLPCFPRHTRIFYRRRCVQARAFGEPVQDLHRGRSSRIGSAAVSRAGQGNQRRRHHRQRPAAQYLQHRAHQQLSARIGDFRLGNRHGDLERRQGSAAGATDVRPAGSDMAVLLRSPRPGGLEAQIWLAPSLHYVAVKVRLSNDRATVEALLDSIHVDETIAQQ